MTTPWSLHAERALPADTTTRAIATEIYRSIADLPITSMHGHVDAGVFDRDEPFGDPAEVLVTPDHYLLRMLVSQGANLAELGVRTLDGSPYETDPRAIFRKFAAGWHLFRGTPTRYWMEHVLVEVFGVEKPLSADTADEVYDQIAALLASDAFRPLALLDRFNIQLIATTDGAADPLAHHASLRARGWGDRIVPTFRPDPFLALDGAHWRDHIDALSVASGIDVASYPAYLSALEQRRQAFVAMGGVATDHGTTILNTTPLADAEAARIFDAALAGTVSAAEAQAFGGHMLTEMARMSTEDGLVMQLHPGSLRNHDPAVQALHGPDVGYDIPFATEFTRALQPLLMRFGHHPRLRLILFTLDEDTYSRELAPLAGVYPAVRLGAPWWFLDAPDAMRRGREAVTETAGFYNTTGFVDDTRAFFSIPARHDLSRRVDSGYLARLVAEHRLELDEAIATAYDLTVTLPQSAYTRT
ncbi:glucuronate isomerase [Demequina sp. SYSU T00039]|uniref:Uronate isomerase n=1 Tax=Demequina lignilytica TaxID=3051663 RepID=A0AAW7M7H7_9MICO|nr:MULTISPECIES: glucuronate isomerase [unclassified Demequina]MDN4478563.1 glucuronate isomerase [Demequina sp. SYSU T00039-1]MDN4486930.1 glucuronate isomerase [Demequina sp. SYSU T00039]